MCKLVSVDPFSFCCQKLFLASKNFSANLWFICFFCSLYTIQWILTALISYKDGPHTTFSCLKLILVFPFSSCIEQTSVLFHPDKKHLCIWRSAFMITSIIDAPKFPWKASCCGASSPAVWNEQTKGLTVSDVSSEQLSAVTEIKRQWFHITSETKTCHSWLNESGPWVEVRQYNFCNSGSCCHKCYRTLAH